MMNSRLVAGAAALAVATVLSGCGVVGGEADTPSCTERRIAEGTGFQTWEPGLLLAISRGIQDEYPQLGGIVDAVADHESEDPGPTDDANVNALVVYGIVMTDLAAHPDLATPDLIAAFEDAARRDGILGVSGLIYANASRTDLDESTQSTLWDFQNLVGGQVAAYRDHGIERLPNRDCPDDEDV